MICRLREGVEGARQDEAHHGGGRLDAEPEGGAGQRQAVGAQLGDHGRRGVQVDRHAELLGLGQDRPVALLVEERVAEVRVRLPALEAELLDAALELGDRAVDVLGVDGGVAGEAVGMRGHGGGQRVVGRLAATCGPDRRRRAARSPGRSARGRRSRCRGVHRGDAALRPGRAACGITPKGSKASAW